MNPRLCLAAALAVLAPARLCAQTGNGAPSGPHFNLNIIGVSHDTISTLDRFSLTECRSKFPVAADADGSIMKRYDSVSRGDPEYAQRTSYVISPQGKVLYTYTAGDPTHHVEYTMNAVKKYVAEHK